MLLLFIILPISFTIPSIFAWKVFEKAGEEGWKTLIPFYNLYIWLKLIRKPMWWYIFLLIPFINVFVYMLMIVEMLKCFTKFGLAQQALAVLFPFVYMPYLGLSAKEKYRDPKDMPKRKKSVVREWVDAIIFAVIAATIIRTFLLEAYTIPTSSMEKSLLVGDYLFVSKISYGPRLPMTPLSFPFVHHTLPLSKDKKSFVEWLKFPYFRFPGLNSIERNDAVVFNYPAGDTLSLKFQSNVSYYDLVRTYGRRRVMTDKINFGEITTRPVDKRENYIKRCIGLPGDTLEIVNQEVRINGIPNENPGKKQYSYKLRTNGNPINPKILERMGITDDPKIFSPSEYELILTEENAQKIKNFAIVKEIDKVIYPAGVWKPEVFPHDSAYKWNVDNFGPLYIPKAGDTLHLNTKNIILYKRLIHAYEGNNLEIKDGKIFINGLETDQYIVKMNYYWMMGDNRHNSMDSRIWGFVPEDHIVGKAVFIWLSLDKNKSLFRGKIRWNRLFNLVN